MNNNNDLTLRKIFIKNRTGIAWNDESNYRYKYYSKSRYNILTGKDRMIELWGFDETKKHIFSKDKITDTIENNPTINLYNFLGESAQHIKGLITEARKIYSSWFGEDDNHCDCCGREKNLLTSGICNHLKYLCSKCADRFYEEDLIKTSKITNIFNNTSTNRRDINEI